MPLSLAVAVVAALPIPLPAALLAIGAPGRPSYHFLVSAALVLFFIPATAILVRTLLPAPVAAQFTGAFRAVTRWAFIGLACALGAAGYMLAELLSRPGWREPATLVTYLTPSLSLALLYALAVLACGWIARRSASASINTGTTPSTAPTRPAALAIRAGGIAYGLAVGAGVLFHRDPWLHVQVLYFAPLVITIPVACAALAIRRHAAPTSPARYARLTVLSLIALLALPLSWVVARELASWQDRRARDYGNWIVRQLKAAHTQSPERLFPDTLPDKLLQATPWGWGHQIDYTRTADRTQFRLSYPLTRHPGASSRYDSTHPGWYWYGASDW